MYTHNGKKATLREDIVDKYAPPRTEYLPTTEQERKASKLSGREITVKKTTVPTLFGKKGERVTIVGDHANVMICENKKGTRISVATELLDINE